MVELTKTVQIGWVEDDDGVNRKLLRELDDGEPAEPQTPYSCSDPGEWVEAFLRDMPNASILYKERLKKWFDACWHDGYHVASMERD